MKRLAIDIGGVIIKKDYNRPNQDTAILDEYNVRFFEDSYDVIKELSEYYELYILSFCGRRREEQSRVALRIGGYNRLIPEDKWLFVRNRLDKLDSMLDNGIDILIDDTWQIVRHIRDAGLRCIHFRNSRRKGDYAENWKHVLKKLKT